MLRDDHGHDYGHIMEKSPAPVLSFGRAGACGLADMTRGPTGSPGNADRFRGFAEACMAECELGGWKVPDLTDPGEPSCHVLRRVGVALFP